MIRTSLYFALASGKDTVVWIDDENCLDTAREIARMRRGFLFMRLNALSHGATAWTYWRNPAHDRAKPRRQATKRRNRRSP